MQGRITIKFINFNDPLSSLFIKYYCIQEVMLA